MGTYIILTTLAYPETEDVPRLARDVQAMVDRGFAPVGGPAIRSGSNRGAYFLQAMFKDEADKPLAFSPDFIDNAITPTREPKV